MGAIISASINVAALPKEKFVKGKDGAVWIKDAEGNSGKIFLADREEKTEAVPQPESGMPF